MSGVGYSFGRAVSVSHTTLRNRQFFDNPTSKTPDYSAAIKNCIGKIVDGWLRAPNGYISIAAAGLSDISLELPDSRPRCLLDSNNVVRGMIFTRYRTLFGN